MRSQKKGWVYGALMGLTKSHPGRDRKKGIGLGSCDGIDQKSRGARSQNRKSSLPSASHNN